MWRTVLAQTRVSEVLPIVLILPGFDKPKRPLHKLGWRSSYLSGGLLGHDGVRNWQVLVKLTSKQIAEIVAHSWLNYRCTHARTVLWAQSVQSPTHLQLRGLLRGLKGLERQRSLGFRQRKTQKLETKNC